jgi:hypothetical protein
LDGYHKLISVGTQVFEHVDAERRQGGGGASYGGVLGICAKGCEKGKYCRNKDLARIANPRQQGNATAMESPPNGVRGARWLRYIDGTVSG